MHESIGGRPWAVSTPHTLATQAAVRAFRAGGNAVDAALAAATTLSVVYPHMCGVGGDLFALVHPPSGDVVAVNASGRAPAGTDAAAARVAGGGAMPLHGPHTVTVPGAVSGWAALHGLGARLPWRDAFSDAIVQAEEGFAVPPSLAATLLFGADRLRADPGLRELFFVDGTSPSVAGEVVRQPALAATLRALAHDGPATWYGGPTGARYALGLAALGVPITPTDLAVHVADVVPALRGRYRDLEVLVHPPNSPGFVLLQILTLIERLGLDPDPLGADAGRLAHLFARSAQDRDSVLADPDHMRVDGDVLVSGAHIDEMVAALESEPTCGPPDRRGASGDTIALVTTDDEGRGVSLIQSLFDGFGSGILEPDTGVVAQDRGACFTLTPDHPNLLAPGKRPAHTLTPVVVRRRGQLAAVAGTMGGYAQPQINAMTLTRCFDLGRNPAQAVAEPRWLVGGTSDTGTTPRVVAEADVPTAVVRSLHDAGFDVHAASAWSSDVGHAHLIVADAQGVGAG